VFFLVFSTSAYGGPNPVTSLHQLRIRLATATFLLLLKIKDGFEQNVPVFDIRQWVPWEAQTLISWRRRWRIEQYPMTLQCISHSTKNVDWCAGKTRCYSLASAWPWTCVCERFSFRSQIWKPLLQLYAGKAGIRGKCKKDRSWNCKQHLLENAEGCLSPSRTYIKRTGRPEYLIPLESPTREEAQSKGLRPVFTAVITPAGSLHP